MAETLSRPAEALHRSSLQNERTAERGVLLVEDEQVSRDLLVHILRRHGYRVAAAGTVAEGLAQLDGQTCAILDLNLPDGLGTEILERIRAEQRPIRVVVATGTTDPALLRDAERYAPDLLLRKPVDMKELLAWLASAA